MPAQQAIPGHGLTPREEAVMDAHDRGIAPGRIAADLGMTVANVGEIIKLFAFSGRNHFEADARRSSAALLAAIRRAHPEHLS